MRWDVIVIGAGAAGLLAAARSAERGRRTFLLEKNRKPGVKILMSGGTRCNLTHATDARGIIAAFGSQGKFLHSALAALGPQDLVDLIEAEGVPTKVEATGKIFPVSNKALDVLNALLRRLTRSGCTLALGEPVRDLERTTEGFRVVTPHQVLLAERVILTTGGRSYPGCGTTGDGYLWTAQLGHTIVTPRPALVPLTVAPTWVHVLQGVTIPDAMVRVLEGTAHPGARELQHQPGSASPYSAEAQGPKDHTIATDRGSFLFTHFGLSGPVVLNVSRAITGHPQPEKLFLQCDFLPAKLEAALDEWLRREASSSGKKQLAVLLSQELPRRLAEALLDQAGLPPDRKAAGLSKAERMRLVRAIKRMTLPISGSLGFAKAEVTAGGISLDEVDSRSMQSKLVPNLYLAGEILDLDGPIGGYNFQAAFSTGWLAGERI